MNKQYFVSPSLALITAFKHFGLLSITLLHLLLEEFN